MKITILVAIVVVSLFFLVQFSLPIIAQAGGGGMSPEELAAEDQAMEEKFLPICINHFKQQVQAAGENPHADRFKRKQYLEYCLKKMKEQAKNNQKETEGENK